MHVHLHLYLLALMAAGAVTTATSPVAQTPVLSGTVLDADGAPIEGAIVAIRSSRAGFEDPTPTATSAADGTFSMGVSAGAPFTVGVHAPGFEPFFERELGADVFPLRVALEPAAISLSGRVVDGDTQEPVASAFVESRAIAGLRSLEAHPLFGLIEVATDDDGNFALAGLGEGPFAVTASAPGYGSARKDGLDGGDAVTLYLFRGVGIYGTVTDPDGAPVEGAFVDADVTGRGFFAGRSDASARRTDEEGRFALLGLEPGRYRLYARHSDFAPAAQELTLDDYDVEVDVVLSAGATVTGRLIDENDEPVRGRAAIEAMDGGAVGRLIASRLSADADEDGFFSIADVPPGEHRLRLSARGYGSDTTELYVGSEPSVDVGDIVLDVGLAIRGVVVDEQGAPVVGARLFAFKRSGSSRGRSMGRPPEERSDAEGHFIFAGLEEGLYNVMAHAPGHPQEMLQTEAGADPVTVVLKPSGSLRGVVTDRDGRPLSRLFVLARSPSRERQGGGRTVPSGDGDGRFVVHDIGEGIYAVEISAPDHVSHVLSDVRVTPGSVTELGTIRLERGARLRGTVVDASGALVPGANVQARTGSRRFSPVDSGVTTDAAGSFELSGLSPGRVDLVVSHPRYAQGRAEVMIDPSVSISTDVEIVLRMGGSLEGYVRSRDGTDIAGRTVQVVPEGGRRSFGDRESVQTGPDGHFRLGHLEAGQAQVSLIATHGSMSYPVQSKRVEIREGETAFVEFDSRQILVTGQVRRRGVPISRAGLDLWPSEQGLSMFSFAGSGTAAPSGPRYLNATSGDDGYFELLVDAPGEYRVRVDASGMGLPSRTVAVPDADTFYLDLDFTGVVLAGRVLDRETEEPVLGAWVNARPEPPRPGVRGGRAQVGTDGSFELELDADMDVEAVALSAYADGYATEERVVRTGPSGVSDIVMSLVPGLQIEGRVHGLGGPASNLNVSAVEDSPDLATPPTQVAYARTVADGSFVLDQLARTRYNVLAGNELSGYGFVASVPAGADDVEIPLRTAGTLEIEVVDTDGSPVEGSIVAVVGIGGRKVRGLQTGTDASGRASLVVPPGNLQVKAVKRPDGDGEAEREGMAAIAVSSGASAAVQVVVRPGAR